MAALYQLAWEDTFGGTALDRAKWNVRIGNWSISEDGTPLAPGWGNNEQQYYRDDAQNLFVGNDRLTIRALRQTSPVQFGQRDHVYGPWARSGEIDILEAMGRCPDLVCGTIHYGGPPQNKTEQSHSYRLPIGTTIHDFHTYALLWEPMRLQWYVDGICYSSISTWGSCPGVEPKLSFPQPFDQKFYLIINLAVGGWFDPEANGIVDNTAFPADFEIDYIRVYQQHKA